ncbi:unnamed protein product, partial [Rotaria sp. Silwood1]
SCSKKSLKIIQLAQDGHGKYSIDYSIKSNVIENRNTKQVKDINVEINDYLQKQTDSNFQLKNLVKLSPVLYEFLTGKKFDINNDPPSSTSTGAQRTTSKN